MALPPAETPGVSLTPHGGTIDSAGVSPPRVGEGPGEGAVTARQTEQPEQAAGSRLFYGWVVVLGTFIVLCIGFGMAYSFASFFPSLEEEFVANRSKVSLVFAITGFLYFSLGAVSGPLADRFGPRRVVLGGIGLIVLGLLLASRAHALWQVYFTYSLGVGVGVGFVYVPAIGSVQRWFVQRRGFASGLAVAGIGIGTLAAPPLAVWLIDAAGWRTTYVLLAVITLAGGTAGALLLEHSPQRRGLLPDGEGVGSGERGAGAGGQPSHSSLPTPRSLSTREAVRSRPFVLLYIAMIMISLGLFIPFVHLVPYAQDHGLSKQTGAVLVGLIGVGSTVGRFALGGTADRLGRRRSVAAMFAGMGLMLLWWLAAKDTWSLAVFAVLFGVCYGGFVALIPALTTDYFGGRNAGGIIGVQYTGVAVGTLIGPTLAGVIYDLRESYVLPIAFGAAADVIAVACILLLAEPSRWRSHRDATETERSPRAV